MNKITSRMMAGNAKETDADLLHSVSLQISGRTICAHGEAAAWPTESFVDKFRDEFLAKASGNASAKPESAYRLI